METVVFLREKGLCDSIHYSTSTSRNVDSLTFTHLIAISLPIYFINICFWNLTVVFSFVGVTQKCTATKHYLLVQQRTLFPLLFALRVRLDTQWSVRVDFHCNIQLWRCVNLAIIKWYKFGWETFLSVWMFRFIPSKMEVFSSFSWLIRCGWTLGRIIGAC